MNDFELAIAVAVAVFGINSGVAYSQTFATCNGCHRPAGYEFIHIITPTREPVTNQQWNVSDH